MSADLEVQIMNTGRPSLHAMRLHWPKEEVLTGADQGANWLPAPLQRTGAQGVP